MYSFSASAEQEELLAKTRHLMAHLIYPAEAVYWESGELPADQMRELQARVKQEGLWAIVCAGSS